MLYRIKTALAYRNFQRRTSAVARTPPVAASPDATCELHTMLGRRDMGMYLLAVKSLLYWLSEVAVVVHSDGSLRQEDFDELARHVAGARFVRAEEADARADAQLAGNPFLAEWRRKDAAYRRLIDVELWRAGERVIILDSDVLTVQRPAELIEWIARGAGPFLLGQPAAPADLEREPGPSDHVQAHFLRRVPAISERLGVPPRFLQGGTAGFCGYFTEISLARIEAALKAALDLGLPMRQWGGDQCLVIYLLSVGGAERLPAETYFNYDPTMRRAANTAMMIHFYGTHRFDGGTYPRLSARVIDRLGEPRPAASD